MRFVLLVMMCVQAVAQTNVKQTLVDASGHRQSGQVTLSWPNFVTSTSVTVSAGKMNAVIVNGNLSLYLYPTVGATPAGVAYAVTMVTGTGSSASISNEVWSVPVSTAPVTRQSVIITQVPNIDVELSLSQLPKSGAHDLDYMGWNDAMQTWEPKTLAITSGMIPTGIAATKIGAGTVDNTKFGYLSNVSSDVQTQLDATSGKNFYIPAAGCYNGASASAFESDITNSPSAACQLGLQMFSAVLVYPTSVLTQGQFSTITPASYSGHYTAKLYWYSSGGSGNVTWYVGTACIPVDGSTGISDNSFTDTSTTVSAIQNVSVITVTNITGCTAGQLMKVRIKRTTGDTMSDNAFLVAVVISFV